VVVVDDGSSDHPEAIASRFEGVRVIHQPNGGLSAARNAGLRASRGEFVVFLDADDRLLPLALEVGVQRLRQHPSAAFTVGRCRLMDEGGSQMPILQPAHPSGDAFDAMLRQCFIWMPGSVMYRRWALDRVGGFQAGVDAAADYDVYLRIARELPIDRHDEVIADYRRHSSCMSAKPAVMLRATLSAVKSQRGFVRRHPRYGAAYANGRIFWRQFYGSLLVDQIRADARVPSRWWQAIGAVASLVRHAPRVLAHHLRRKARVAVNPRRKTETVMQASRIPLTK
jgi:glycosyltransferase involved in cell wall biosynthesis